MENLVGRKFGRLEVKEYSHKNKWVASYWKCLCDCGNTKVVRGSSLTSGATRSCGCLLKEVAIARSTIHGQHKSITYKARRGMLDRCYNPNSKSYKHYGGRGITVCDRWLGKDGFINFLDDMGDCPKGMAIERIDNNKGYCPENCKWATSKEQNNNKRNNHIITFQSKTQTLAQWAEEIGVTYRTLVNRIDTHGWSEERALTEPMHRRNKKMEEKRNEIGELL